MKDLALILSGTAHHPWDFLATSFFILAIILAGVFYYIGRKYHNKPKVFNTIMFIFGLIFISMEIWHETRQYLRFGQYDWSSFPFQFCSVSMYFCLFVPWIKEGKVKKTLIMWMALYTSLSGILPYLFAQSNLTRWPDELGVFFSFSWHTLLVSVGFLALGKANLGYNLKKEWKTFLLTFVLFIGVTCIAQLLNVTIHYTQDVWEAPLEGFKTAGWIENYELDPDSASLFYISPYFVSNIGFVLQNVWIKYGFLLAWILYVLTFGLLTVIVYTITASIRFVFHKLTKTSMPNDELAIE